MASSVPAFLVAYVMTPYLIRWLEAKGMCVKDIMKPGNVMVARPGGISLMAGIVTAELALYAVMPQDAILAMIATTGAAFVVGLIDDLKGMGGWFKPIGLAVSAAPIILLGAHDTNLEFPPFGDVQIPILYFGVVVAMIAVTGNTINSIDVANGVASGFMMISGTAMTVSLLIMQNYEVAVASLPLLLATLAFYKFHKNPSRIFPGDSGALAWGGMYGAIAIVGGAEVVAAIALLPAIINSFLFLASTKRIVEHKEIKAKAVRITDDFKMEATRDRRAATTLVSLIIARKPMTEEQVCAAIHRLAAFSGILAVATAIVSVIF